VGVLVEQVQGAVCQHLLGQHLVFGIAAIAPVDGIGLGQAGDIGHPLIQVFKTAGHWRNSSALCGLVFELKSVAKYGVTFVRY
jgi:hypothetical protein